MCQSNLCFHQGLCYSMAAWFANMHAHKHIRTKRVLNILINFIICVSGYSILLPAQVSCQTIRLPASSTQPNSEESMWAKARSVMVPVKPFSNKRSGKLTPRTRIMAWLFAPGGWYTKNENNKPSQLNSFEHYSRAEIILPWKVWVDSDFLFSSTSCWTSILLKLLKRNQP